MTNLKPIFFAGAGLVMMASLAQADGNADNNADNGEQLYRAFCTQCHGAGGKGDGINAATMEIKPRDHTDPKEMGGRTDEDLFTAIKQGGIAVNKSVLMPNWDANLTDPEITDVIAYLRRLSNTGSK